MSNDRLKNWNLYCKKCKKSYTRMVWSSKLEEQFCEKHTKIQLQVIESHIDTFNISTHKKGRSMKERRQRSSKDFQQNILPTLPKTEQRYFKQKYGYK